MNNNTVSKVAAWVGTAIAVSVALYFTKNPICLWAFAFPMIEKMVHLLAFSDRKFLILVTVCSYLVFALFYIIVYMVTSKQYYKIVSGKQEESLFS